ncbi:hypothetical protein K505DRAFT_36525 [Melanomma pulvis-pyrius CBS 109.77]|uniref:Uncharacterized protein n=1 Tax=Melanomma pulvis-pyrius CBS 109.77 TaxID=1314802 RepID=A0A6A6XW25_9PLEO|nr:hypothetical protein K505DRAFT_36525 [Melanomma pulvis-pyrius CBS 109.77]
MNRFLTRRKKDGADDNATAGKKAKKGKKGQMEPKLELNLATALPATDDFRTSLIMPSLSTRFSMLREQDDPSSKIGKASDDSVLQPKRQSRLHEFGFFPGGLSDIAEVQSINGSIRPPFASERQNSFDSHATDDGGSMMTRSRPGEGNVLFGGRQKVYKISNTGSARSLGRALYEDDIHMSAFQKLRQQEKDKKDGEDQAREDHMLHSDPSSPTRDTAYSPSVEDYSQRRETTSSTNSGIGNTRTSTAATSIASQGANSIATSSPILPNSTAPISPTELNRSTTKTRRLYDQGLDQHIYDQQSSALHRLNTIQRTRAPTGRSTPPLPFSQTRSATNLNDRFNRSSPFRMDSPTSMGPGPGIFSGMDPQSAGSSPIISRPQSPPPTSPLASDSEDAQTLNSALQPNDRGKATAMGAFNKPAQAFSEQQYAERMKRMQQERDTSVPKLENPRKPSLENSRKPSLRERAEIEKRKRTEVGASERLQSDPSTEKKQAPSAFSVFQSAANQMKSPTTTTPSLPHQQPEQSPESQKGRTFFASPGSSDDEEEAPKSNVLAKPSEPGRRPDRIPTATGPAPPILDHPALRSRSNSRLDTSGPPALRERSASRPAAAQHKEPRSSPSAKSHDEPTTSTADPDVDSPTLGPNNGGLSGLIRQHLRNVSSVSSDYGDSNQIMMSPPPTATAAPLSLQTQNVGFQRRQQPPSDSDTPAHSSYSHSNPWDLDDLDNPYYGERDSVSSTSPVDTQRPKPQASNVITTSTNDTPQWEKDINNKTHHRGDSNQTQDEREAFQRDLAQRQRAIQESLRNNNTTNSRSRSGSPAAASRGGGLKTALSMLRAKSSHESFATVEAQRQQDAQTKAMRMLGIGANSANASNTSLSGLNDRFHVHDQQVRQKPPRVLQQSEQDAQRELESRDPRSKGRTPPASSRSSSTRDRSSSEVSSGRSRSRPGQYRDDLDQAMAEGTGSRTAAFPANTSPSVPGYAANATQPLPSDRPSLDSQGRMRSRSNSKTAAASYFESKHLQPIITGNGPNGSSPRLSPGPVSPHPNLAASGLPASPRPSPGGPSPGVNSFRPQMSPIPPFSANNTPPVSGPNTPVVVAFNPNATPQPMAKVGTLRKKSIAKADISEPVFVSTTSVIDLVSLPPGASLKNGIEAPPPVPPINPMRRRFGFGRSENQDPAVHSPQLPFAADPTKTNSSDALSSQTTLPRQRLRKTSSEGKSLHGQAQAQAGPSPAMPSSPFGARNGSPPRPIRDVPVAQRPMDGSMF